MAESLCSYSIRDGKLIDCRSLYVTITDNIKKAIRRANEGITNSTNWLRPDIGSSTPFHDVPSLQLLF